VHKISGEQNGREVEAIEVSSLILKLENIFLPKTSRNHLLAACTRRSSGKQVTLQSKSEPVVAVDV
jgi:hypothetical protein